jgi:hypothetical protein
VSRPYSCQSSSFEAALGGPIILYLVKWCVLTAEIRLGYDAVFVYFLSLFYLMPLKFVPALEKKIVL